MGKYVYWFKTRAENPRGFGFADVRIYFNNIKKAISYQNERITTFYDSTVKNPKTKKIKPKIHKQLRSSAIKQGVHIN